ncbi:MaoC family dehydratase [Phenylobacterium sp.]|uniref:MaoC family dehydratase n=1 Tax=Phenylobacterium sp. TaxID=1871053 RepID=UPI002733F9C0|nr:MaoC family dehydratase [Phenylobacterium sp.]MDP3659437.1 MaoC/PaaZ C-terminal domain-containing protein [Phenylobacterium sp.]
MPIYYPDILQQKSAPKTFSYVEKDVMLYAVGVGMGADPLNEQELDFVYEKRLKVLPSAVTVLATANGGFWPPANSSASPGSRETTLDYTAVLHGEQKVELHRPLPPSGAFTVTGGVTGAIDKGKDKGAILFNESVWTDAAGEKVVTLTTSSFARADGGFGGPSEGAPKPHPTPTRAPDKTIEIATRPDQCAIYRLSGDTNPLHIDPEAARVSGFDRPILHGLCTFGITCRAVLQAMLDYDTDQMASHQLRWSSPVYPGDVFTIDLWRDGKEISFEVHVKARGVTVVKNGLTVVR